MQRLNSYLTVAAVLVCIALPISGYIFALNSTWAQVTVKVADKGVKRTGDEDRYLIYTSTETFQNTDSLLFGKWNSADVQGSIESGHTYRFEVVGWRNPFLPRYRNVLAAQRVDKEHHASKN